MINWVEVVRRLLALYKVKTMVELGMAMGIPVDLKSLGDVEETGLGWKILEIAVHDKKASWDWLLTGQGDAPEGYCPEDQANRSGEKPADDAFARERKQAANSLPRIETRELIRTLLGPDESGRMPQRRGADVVDELKDLKSTMQKELDKVDKLLDEERR